MTKFHVSLKSREDGSEFTVEVEARSADAARDEAGEDYPECRILDVFNPVDRDAEIYRRANRDYEDNYYYAD